MHSTNFALFSQKKKPFYFRSFSSTVTDTKHTGAQQRIQTKKLRFLLHVPFDTFVVSDAHGVTNVCVVWFPVTNGAPRATLGCRHWGFRDRGTGTGNITNISLDL